MQSPWSSLRIGLAGALSLAPALAFAQDPLRTPTTIGGFYTVDAPHFAGLARSPAGLELRVNGNLFQCFGPDGLQVGVDTRDQRRAAQALPLPDGNGSVGHPPGGVANGFTIFGDIDDSTIDRVTVPVSHFDCATGFGPLHSTEFPSFRYPNGSRYLGCSLPGETGPTVFDAAGIAFINQGQRLCAFDSATDTFAVPVDDQTFDGFLGPQIADRLEKLGKPPLDGDPDYTWAIRGVVAIPDGSLYMWLQLNYLGNTVREASSLLRRAPDGVLSLVGGIADNNDIVSLGQTFNATPWLWRDEDTGLVLSGIYSGGIETSNDFQFIAAWDPTTPERPATFITAVGVGPDVPFVTPSGLIEFDLRLDRDLFDFDGDGLSENAEIQLGTNPRRLDTDGDGAPDGFEVRVAETDPLDHAAPVLTAAQTALTRIAPTTMPDDAPIMHQELHIAAPSRVGPDTRMQEGAHAACVFGVDTTGDVIPDAEECLDDDGVPMEPRPLPGSDGQFTDDGACYFYEKPDQSGVVRRDRNGSETVVYAGDTLRIDAVSCELIFVLTPQALQVIRVAGGEAYTVYDPARDCPLAGNAEQLTACHQRSDARDAGHRSPARGDRPGSARGLVHLPDDHGRGAHRRRRPPGDGGLAHGSARPRSAVAACHRRARRTSLCPSGLWRGRPRLLARHADPERRLEPAARRHAAHGAIRHAHARAVSQWHRRDGGGPAHLRPRSAPGRRLHLPRVLRVRRGCHGVPTVRGHRSAGHGDRDAGLVRLVGARRGGCPAR